MTGNTGWALDHLVVAARTLDEGVAWCEATLGVAPDAGGVHPLMGTHNRVLAIGSARFPRAYLEIIAVDPSAPAPGRARWFDLDDAALQAALARRPALIHWVARCCALDTELEALRRHGIERGDAVGAERPTPAGLLRWRIAVRHDGARLARGALPTLIEWGAVHPAHTLPERGVVLEGLTVRSLPAAARDRLPAGVVHADDDGDPLAATLATPRGRVVLNAPADPGDPR